MFQCVFAGAKRRSGEIAKFQFFETCRLRGVLHSAAKKSQKVPVMVLFFFVYFAVLSLILELKQTLEARAYSEMNPKPPKRVELLWSSMGKIISSLYPLLFA